MPVFVCMEFSIEVTVYFLTEIVDIDINEVRTRVKVRVPHFVGYIHPADNFLCILDHIYQQVVFFGESLMSRPALFTLLSNRFTDKSA